MAWLLGGALLCGAAVGFVIITLPQPASVDSRGVVIDSAIALVAGTTTILLRHHFTEWAARPLLLLGVACITAAIPIAGNPQSDTELLYIYPVLFAFYFFSPREAWGVLGLTMVAYALAVSTVDPNSLAARVLMLGAVLTASGFAFGLLRGRAAALVHALSVSARTDPLTGLLNRRGLQEAVEAELVDAKPGAYSVIVADLDDFKQVNDKLGHLGGDMTLERVTALISRTKRASDHSARLGGEEFAVALPGADRAQAEAIAERLRIAIERDFADGPAPITSSIGIAVFPEHGRTLEELLHSADRALYAAKDFGKNRTLLYDEALRGVVLDLATEPGIEPR